MNIPELPFIPDQGTEVKILSEDSNNSTVYEIQVGGQAYVIKDILSNSFTIENIPGETIEDKAANIKLFFDVLKEKIGKRAWDTYFFVSKNASAEPCIRVVQKKIEGCSLAEFEADGLDPESARTLNIIKEEVRAQLIVAFADERLNSLDFSKTKEWVQGDALFEKNIFITEDGNLYLIDLI